VGRSVLNLFVETGSKIVSYYPGFYGDHPPIMKQTKLTV